MSSETDANLARRVFCGGFAFLLVWTLGVQFATFTAQPFDVLHAVFGCAFIVGVLAFARPFSLGATAGAHLPELKLVVPRFSGDGVRPYILAGALGGVVLVLAGGTYSLGLTSFMIFWVVCLAAGGFALLFAGEMRALSPLALHCEPVDTARNVDRAFLWCALAMLLVFAFVSVSDADDSLFLNFAVGEMEARGALMQTDTMLGLDGLDFVKSTYRLESYQLMTALLADLTGLPVILVAHTVVPALLCIWAASVLVLIHAALFPRHFGVTLGMHLALLIALDGSVPSFGYHAIPRFIHGKGPFLTVMVPLIAFLTVVALRQGSWRVLWALAASMVIALGFTANAIYVGALTSAMIGITYFLTGGATRWRVLRLPLIVLYPGALGVYLVLFDPPSGSEFEDAGSVGLSLWRSLGTAEARATLLAGFLAAACLPLIDRRLRPLAVCVLATLLFVLNPFLWDLYGRVVTGNVNDRLFWVVPFPFLLAVLLGLVWSTRVRLLQVPLALTLAYGLFWPGSIVHRAELGPTLLKVPAEDFALAERLRDTLEPSDLLLAHEEVSLWVPTLEQAPHVVEGRLIYSAQRADPDFQEVLASRLAVFRHWSWYEGHHISFVAPPTVSTLESLGVTAVLVDSARAHHRALLDDLLAHGFSRRWTEGDFSLLVRDRQEGT